MTTDQIKRSGDAAQAAEGDVAGEAESVLAAAQADAKQMLAKARYEAFRMVTDARAEAESILAEAEQSIPTSTPTSADTSEATEASATIIAEAHERAAEIVAEAEQAAARLYETSRASVEQQTAILRERHAALEEKVNITQALLNDLEKRLAMIAAPSSPNPEPRTPTLAYSLAGETVATHDKGGPQTVSLSDDRGPLPPAASAADHSSASVATAPASEGTEQGSFYTRRSANLPSIGASGGQDALSAVRSMRSKMDQQA